MRLENLKIGKILTFSQKDYDSSIIEIQKHNSIIEILNCSESIFSKQEIENFNVPIIIIGYGNANKIFKNINPLIEKIQDKVYWTNGYDENKKKFSIDIKSFINNSAGLFFPKSYLTYDAILDGDFSDFINKHINNTKNTFIYFYEKALYLFNDKNSYGINLESIKYVGLNVKEILTNFVNNNNCTSFSYNNLCQYVYPDKIKKQITSENVYWTRYGEEIGEDFLKYKFYGFDIKRYVPFLMSLIYEKSLEQDEYDSSMRFFEKDNITQWMSTQEIFIDPTLFEKVFKEKDTKKIKIKYSNKRTITGRINAVEGLINPQTLKKEGDERKCIVSRFEKGKIVVFDYVSFELKIALYLTGDKEFIKKYQNKDLHEETAKIIYKKNNVTPEERDFGKKINYAIQYGGGETKLQELLKIFGDRSKDIVKEIKFMLKPIFDKSEEFKIIYEELGYLINDFKTIIRPQKEWAIFNNYVQSTAAEIVVDKLFEIKELLKAYKSYFLFQVFDSFVFDICPDEELELVSKLKGLLSEFKTLKFETGHQIGDNFWEASK